jgi:hypothetical protein
MKLREYLTAIGDAQAAKLFGISERAARSYRYGVRTPKPATARQIVRRSKGALSMQDIYGG